MAASMQRNVRIKLTLQNSERPCWFLVDKSVSPLIKDVQNQLASKYNTKRKFLELYLDGCWLPTGESSDILRDGDTIEVRYKKDVVSPPKGVVPCRPTQGSVTNDPIEAVHIQSWELLYSASPDDRTQIKKKRKKKKQETQDIPQPKRKHIDDLGGFKHSDNIAEKHPEDQINLNLSNKQDDKSSENNDDNAQTPGGTSAKKKRVRRKKRRRQLGNSDLDKALVTPIPDQPRNRTDIPLKVNKNQPEYTPRYIPPANKQNHGSHIKFTSDNESESSSLVPNSAKSVQPQSHQTARAVIDSNQTHTKPVDEPSETILGDDISDHVQEPCPNPEVDPQTHESSMSVDEFVSHDIPGYVAIPPPGSLNENLQTTSWQTKKKIPRQAAKLKGAQVFNRRKYKKQGSYALSREEQMNGCEPPTDEIYDNAASVPENGDPSPANEDPEPEPIDIARLTLLSGLPRVGDEIVYKVLEMSENYTPEISDFRRANVLAVDSSKDELELEVLSKTVKKTPGIFDLVVEDEEEILTNVSSENKITVNRSSLMDVHLMKPQ